MAILGFPATQYNLTHQLVGITHPHLHVTVSPEDLGFGTGVALSARPTFATAWDNLAAHRSGCFLYQDA